MENTLPFFAEFNFNPLDITAFAILAFCLYAGSRKGLVKMVFTLASGLLSFYITSRFYPVVSVFLKKNTNIYFLIKAKIIEMLAVGEAIKEYISMGEDAVISNLPLPESILGLVKESNIPSVYELLNVATLEDYIGSFLANMILNVFCAAAVFILVSLAMRFIVIALDLIARLPLIRRFNRMGGALAGACMGFIIIWAAVNLYCLLFIVSPDNELILSSSHTGIFIYEHGLLLKGFTHIFN